MHLAPRTENCVNHDLLWKQDGFCFRKKKLSTLLPLKCPFDVSSDLLLQAAEAKSGAVKVATRHRRQSASPVLAISLAICFSV